VLKVSFCQILQQGRLLMDQDLSKFMNGGTLYTVYAQ
jgi:hypothetical protein